MNIKICLLFIFAFSFVRSEYELIEAGQPVGYLNYLHDQIRQVKYEMANNNNIRPSTPLSLYDIAFSLSHIAPFYPPQLWKQDHITRRRKVAKFFTHSNLQDRIYAFRIRERAVEWAKKSDYELREEYTEVADGGLERLFGSLEKFISEISHQDHSDLHVLEGCIGFEKNVSLFLESNNETFHKTLKSVNNHFDAFVNPAGELRVSLESIRYDAAERVKKIRQELYKETSYQLTTISNDIRSLLTHVIVEDRKSLQAKMNTLSQFQSSLKTRKRIHKDILKYRKEMQAIWKQVIGELIQSPWQMDYWVDALAEVHQVATELGKSVYKSYKHRGISL